MKFFDTHIHLLAPEWLEPVASRLECAAGNGIELLLQPGVRQAGWFGMIELARLNSGVYVAPGLHPMCAASWDSAAAIELQELCNLPQVVAIGEIGLDGLLDVDSTLQERAFCQQLEIAVAAGLPVLIHCRRQTDAVLRVLAEVDIRRVGGIWHGFSGSPETAQRIVDLGLLLGVGPVLLRENVRKLPTALRSLPPESLVLETDAPDMAPGPETLLAVAEKLAALRGWTLAETARITTTNARQLLKV